EPSQIERAELLRHVECFAHGPRAIDVQHDLHVIAGGLASGTYTVDVDLVQLQMTIAALECAHDVLRDEFRVVVSGETGVAWKRNHVAAAQELVDGLLCNLSGNIPQRDVDGGEAVNQRAASSKHMEFFLQIERQLAGLRCVPTNAFGGK